MLKINAANVIINGHEFDYELENGVQLHSSDWNGEFYTVNENGAETTYKPVYEKVEEDTFEIIGFEEHY